MCGIRIGNPLRRRKIRGDQTRVPQGSTNGLEINGLKSISACGAQLEPESHIGSSFGAADLVASGLSGNTDNTATEP